MKGHQWCISHATVVEITAEDFEGTGDFLWGVEAAIQRAFDEPGLDIDVKYDAIIVGHYPYYLLQDLRLLFKGIAEGNAVPAPMEIVLVSMVGQNLAMLGRAW